MEFPTVTRRRFLTHMLTLIGMAAVPAAVLAQTPGMTRRTDRRGDRGERVNQRGENMVERSDDPLGVRGVNRREDRREIRQDRQVDRYDRVF